MQNPAVSKTPLNEISLMLAFAKLLTVQRFWHQLELLSTSRKWLGIMVKAYVRTVSSPAMHVHPYIPCVQLSNYCTYGGKGCTGARAGTVDGAQRAVGTKHHIKSRTSRYHIELKNNYSWQRLEVGGFYTLHLSSLMSHLDFRCQEIKGVRLFWIAVLMMQRWSATNKHHLISMKSDWISSVNW